LDDCNSISNRGKNFSPPSSAEVKNEWSYTSTLQYVFMTWRLVEHRDNFTFLTLPPHPDWLWALSILLSSQ